MGKEITNQLENSNNDNMTYNNLEQKYGQNYNHKKLNDFIK